VPSVIAKSTLRPRNRSFPNANPARVQNSTVAAVVTVETTSEFHNARPMFC
jgi:hypothetical protein